MEAKATTLEELCDAERGPRAAACRGPRTRGGVQEASPRDRDPDRVACALRACASANAASAGLLTWAPEHARHRRPRGTWGPRSGALAGVRPAPHSAPGPGAQRRRPPEQSAGQGGVPASGECARVPLAAAARCPAGHSSRIPAAGPCTDPGLPGGCARPGPGGRRKEVTDARRSWIAGTHEDNPDSPVRPETPAGSARPCTTRQAALRPEKRNQEP